MTSSHIGAHLPHRIRLLLADKAPRRSQPGDRIRAAVVAPLFLNSADLSLQVWLARRSETLRTHQGQIALPGGKWEPTDRDLLETAVREAHEEIGLTHDQVEILGSLDDLHTRTGYVITPFVGWVAEAFVPAPMACEVARVFSAPLALFERAPDTVQFPSLLGDTPVPCWRHAGEIIWGATAAMLRDLVRTIGPSTIERTLRSSSSSE